MSRRIQFQRDVLNAVDVVISPSQFLRGMHMDFGVDANRIVYSRQGHDFDHAFGTDAPNTHTRKPGMPLRVGYLGQIKPAKGVHVAVQALRHLPAGTANLTIWGDALRERNYVQEIRRMANGDAHITFGGTYARADLARVMQSLDVVVVPSLWYENSPNVILEAFGHHVPVVASNFGGMAELVQHGRNGLTFEMGNAQDLARQLQRLIDVPDLLTELRRGAAQSPPLRRPKRCLR